MMRAPPGFVCSPAHVPILSGRRPLALSPASQILLKGETLSAQIQLFVRYRTEHSCLDRRNGIAGMSTAYLLACDGKSVVVLDDGPIGGGMTARTTAHLTNALDNRYFEIERLHGKEGARLAAASHTAAIDAIEAIVKREAIRCEFARLDGFLFVPPRESTKVLDDELAAVHRAGLTDIVKVERAPWDSYDSGPALRFPRQAQFHPLKYLAGLAKAIKAHGCLLYTQTHATSIAGGKKSRIESIDGGVVTAGSVVVATNTPVNDLIAIHTKQASYQTYVIGARVPKGSVSRALYWDTPDPYHYVRIETVGSGTATYDVLIVGGEDYKTCLLYTSPSPRDGLL